ncbi:amino acid transporter [Microbacterium halophytorum]|uniref:amino acid transporter n=1 Tax=Microbacterium halophytorum TaxID=2067568 RepID=UPI0018E07921|nr:amino acid transporter [Microbacterium halophytorum]
MTDKTRRRDLMRPAQLLGVAFVCAAFAGIITATSMGAFTSIPGDEKLRVWTIAGVVAGVAFIAVLLIVSLLLLAIDPADVEKTVDGPVLIGHDEHVDPDDAPGAASEGDDQDGGRERGDAGSPSA